jgi:hypothetical protein
MSRCTVLSFVGAVALAAAVVTSAYAFPIWVHIAYLDPAGREVGYRHLLCDGTWISSGTTAGRPVRTWGDCAP